MASASRATADDFEEGSITSPRQQTAKQASNSQRPNAFAELMKQKPKLQQQPDIPSQRTFFYGRDGLAAYTTDPAAYPSSRVVYYNDKFVVINDMFPKSLVHLLILPRDAKKNVLSPQQAFDDPRLLADCRAEEKKVRAIVASELRRRLGSVSRSDQDRLAAMDSEDPPHELPSGRDWDAEIISGIHANPSMNHLHIHVLSRDMHSEYMKKRNHYLSFTTDFFVGLDQFPLNERDPRRNYGHFPEDMLCWRCGKNFQNKMARLKDHLGEEFDEWKRD